jgi:hypothetical protein
VNRAEFVEYRRLRVAITSFLCQRQSSPIALDRLHIEVRCGVLLGEVAENDESCFAVTELLDKCQRSLRECDRLRMVASLAIELA